MRRDARMLAAPLGRPVGLGEAWEVSETWFEEVEGGPDELHVRVARRRGHAVPCPECGVPCGVHDARERTWRHLDIWQSGTYARRAVPRTDCPEHGAGTVPVPWEVRPNPHLAALFEAQVLAACMRGSTWGTPSRGRGSAPRRRAARRDRARILPSRHPRRPARRPGPATRARGLPASSSRDPSRHPRTLADSRAE